MPNLTRDEAAGRAALLTVDSYAVDLDLTTGAERFRSVTTIRLTAGEATTTWLDLVAPQVVSVSVDGRDIAVEHDGERLALPLAPGERTVVVTADCAYMHTGEGLHRFIDPVDGEVYLYTQFEPMDACRVFACFDQPDLKATWQLTVTGPAAWTVISNSPTPEPEPVAPDISRWRFDPTPRVSPYITALVAGRYAGVTDSVTAGGKTIPLGLYCRASLLEHLDADEIFEVTKQGFAFFTEQFGMDYPFAKYDQVMVAEFNAGAMENAGCVTFHEDYAIFRSRVTAASRDWRANTILHEMAHMWFGDLVTMRWWDDLWLNESFAEFMAYHAMAEGTTAFADSWTGFAAGRKAWGYRQDALSSTHPIAADAPDLHTARMNFDGITYAKGASVLRQLVAFVGVDNFMAGVREYFRKHAWGNTVLADLLAELERASGRDLSRWTETWLQHAGTNTLLPEVAVDGSGTLTELTIRQTAPADHPTLRPHRIGIGGYDTRDGRLVRRDLIEVDIDGEATTVDAFVGQPRPDLLLLNDGDYSFAKIRLDEHSAATATAGLAQLDDSLARALVWSAAWDMTRDAELAASDFLRLVVNGCAAETHQVVLSTVLRQAESAWSVFVAPARREAARADLVAGLRALATEAAAGSDHQLAFVRTAVRLAASDDDLAWVRGLLTGSVALPELQVDADLRWALLARLVASGQADDAEIDAELQRDATANGQRQAATVRAARPTAAAKEEAWQAAVFDTSLPNALQTATIAGFQQPDQLDLLRPYAERYFTDAPQAFERLTDELATNVAEGLFPSLIVDVGTVAGAESFLAAGSWPTALSRAVAEGRDSVVRALAAQQRDAG